MNTSKRVRQVVDQNPTAIYNPNAVIASVWADEGLALTDEQITKIAFCSPADTIIRSLSRERTERRRGKGHAR